LRIISFELISLNKNEIPNNQEVKDEDSFEDAESESGENFISIWISLWISEKEEMEGICKLIEKDYTQLLNFTKRYLQMMMIQMCRENGNSVLFENFYNWLQKKISVFLNRKKVMKIFMVKLSKKTLNIYGILNLP